MNALFSEPHLRTDQEVCFRLLSHTYEWFVCSYSLIHMVCLRLQFHTYEWFVCGYSLIRMVCLRLQSHTYEWFALRLVSHI
jgi:hypothetical protein